MLAMANYIRIINPFREKNKLGTSFFRNTFIALPFTGTLNHRIKPCIFDDLFKRRVNSSSIWLSRKKSFWMWKEEIFCKRGHAYLINKKLQEEKNGKDSSCASRKSKEGG
jgi:hypothetical protein